MTAPKMIAEWLSKVEGGTNLSAGEAEEVMDELLEGRLAHEQIVNLLISLRTKGEAVEELVGFARAMRRRSSLLAKPPTALGRGAQRPAQIAPLVDTCGTG